MSEERPDEVYKIKKGEPGFTCCYCECDPAAHMCGWKCPIFNKELICSQCCQIDVMRKDAPKVFSERLGRDITREEIDAACGGCGRNHAVEDEALADTLQSNDMNPNKEPQNEADTKNG